MLSKQLQVHNKFEFYFGELSGMFSQRERDITADSQLIKKVDLGISNGDFHLDSRLNTDGSDLLDNFRRTVQVNESLVDPHLESIPSLRTFTTRSFPRSYSQSPGSHPN